MARLKTESPFTPGRPAPIERFVGRQAQIEEVVRYQRQAVAGRPEHLFLAAERGVGKTSLARYLLDYAESQEGMLGVYVHLGGITGLPELVRQVFEGIANAAARLQPFSELRRLFGDYIQKIELGVTLSFRPPEAALQTLVGQFARTLGDLVASIRRHRTGLFLVLDDLNGIADDQQFANWYKSFVDSSATLFDRFHACVMVVGLPQQRDGLYGLQPSLPRVFRQIGLGRLTDADVTAFYRDALASASVTAEPVALDYMARFANGHPIAMQEIGDAAFWLDDDGHLDHADAADAVASAADSIGRKYLDPVVSRAIRSDSYRSILAEVAQGLDDRFNRRTLMSTLAASERRSLDNFLRRLRELDVIVADPEGGAGAYRFTNPLYPVYIAFQGMAARG